VFVCLTVDRSSMSHSHHDFSPPLVFQAVPTESLISTLCSCVKGNVEFNYSSTIHILSDHASAVLPPVPTRQEAGRARCSATSIVSIVSFPTSLSYSIWNFICISHEPG
jgi:hypothetical protein